MTTATAQVTNFKEFLESRGMEGETPYRWARALYKYTDCGPWTVFITLKEKARTETLIASVFETKKGVEIRPNANPDKEFVDFMAFLGFNEEGKMIEKTTMDEFRSLIRSYQRSKGINKRNLTTAYREGVLTVRQELEIPEQYAEVYYEDNEVNDLNPDDIIGIKIGSIVEGSDVEIDPVTLMFPFDPAEVDRVIQEINDEASFYWERDNSDHFCLNAPNGSVYTISHCWGEIKWCMKLKSSKVVKAVEKILNEDLVTEYDSPFEIEGCKGWTLTKYMNDWTY